MSHLYKRGQIWHAEFVVLGVRYRRSTGTKLKSDAQKIVDKWVADAQLTGRGVSRTSTETLADLVKEFDTWLGNRSDHHRKKTLGCINKTIAAARWDKPRDITHLSCETAIRSLIDRRTGKPLGQTSVGHYITAMKAFTKWLVKLKHALPVDPLDAMKKPSTKTDRRRIRRFLLPEEWKWLKQSPNAILYETAIETGLRASELAAIRPHHVKQGHILLPAKFTKNGQVAKQLISEGLQERIVDSLPFTTDRWKRWAEMLEHDLAASRQAYEKAGGKDPYFLKVENEEGKVLDFHALRHTTGAWLTIAGENPKVVQTVMRHSTITLTFETYGHLMPDDTRNASDLLAKMLAG